MLYTKPSFTVPSTGYGQLSARETCERDGHAFADVKGKCVRCAQLIRSPQGFNSDEGEE
jgi:hypothetical protein